MKLPALIMARTWQALHKSEVAYRGLACAQAVSKGFYPNAQRPLESVRQGLQQDQYQSLYKLMLMAWQACLRHFLQLQEALSMHLWATGICSQQITVSEVGALLEQPLSQLEIPHVLHLSCCMA